MITPYYRELVSRIADALVLRSGLVTIAYRDSGPVDGQVVVLLHGFTNDADYWTEVTSELHRLTPGLRVVAPDLRGHGASTKPHDPASISIEQMAKDVVALLDALNIVSATVVGHSMGSLVAQDLALNHPERIDSLVLISTTSDATKTTILADWLRKDVLEGWRIRLQARGVSEAELMSLTPRDVDPGIVSWMQQFWNLYPVTPDRPTNAVARKCADLPLATWFGGVDAVITFMRDLSTLQVPTLVLWGAQDAFFTANDQERLVQALQRAAASGPTFRWKQFGRKPLPANGLQVDDLGHNLTWEIPIGVADDIVNWLRSGEPTSREWFVAPDGEIVSEPLGAIVRGG